MRETVAGGLYASACKHCSQTCNEYSDKIYEGKKRNLYSMEL